MYRGCVIRRGSDKPTSTGVTEGKGPYKFHTDACDKQMVYVLLQELEDRSNRPDGRRSRTQNDKKQTLAKTHRDCLAVK